MSSADNTTKNLNPELARKDVGFDLDLNRLRSGGIPERLLLKTLILKGISRRQTYAKFTSKQRVRDLYFYQSNPSMKYLRKKQYNENACVKNEDIQRVLVCIRLRNHARHCSHRILIHYACMIPLCLHSYFSEVVYPCSQKMSDFIFRGKKATD